MTFIEPTKKKATSQNTIVNTSTTTPTKKVYSNLTKEQILNSKELIFKIFDMLVMQRKSMSDISASLNVENSTFWHWFYTGDRCINNEVSELRRKLILGNAEKFLHDYVETGNDERIQADLTKFALKTLGKQHYSEANPNTINMENVSFFNDQPKKVDVIEGETVDSGSGKGD